MLLLLFLKFCLFPSSGNVVACLVNLPALPLRIPSVLGANVGSFSFYQPLFPPTGFLSVCLQITAGYSFSSSFGSFDSPVAYPARFPLFSERALAAIYFYQPRLLPIGFVAGCLRFPSKFSSSSSSLGSFSVPVLYPVMLLALCEHALADLSSARSLSNEISSTRAASSYLSPPSNSLSPCNISLVSSAASSL